MKRKTDTATVPRRLPPFDPRGRSHACWSRPDTILVAAHLYARTHGLGPNFSAVAERLAAGYLAQ